MKASPTALSEVLLIEPNIFSDSRGFFYESWNDRTFAAMGIHAKFVQDNHALSGRSVLRGLHFQLEQTQGKLVRCVAGEVFDVAVDVRRSSPGFGRWTGMRLSAENKHMLWIPEGFAHGYLVLSDFAEILYKATAFYTPKHERVVRWDDPAIGINWPIKEQPILAPRDAAAPLLAHAEVLS